MSVLKTILSSVLWALLVLFIPIFGLETVSQSSLGIGLFKFFILALISLFCFSGLITSIESALLSVPALRFDTGHHSNFCCRLDICSTANNSYLLARRDFSCSRANTLCCRGLLFKDR